MKHDALSRITERITLFGQEPGVVLPLRENEAAIVFVRGGRGGLKPQKPKSPFVEKSTVHDVVRRHGGLMICMTDDERVSVKWERTPGYEPPARALLLSPANRSEFVSTSTFDGRILNRGEHILFPVDMDAQQRLEGFNEVLEWLPGDRALLVRQSLRGPSLDWRLAELEARLEPHARAAPSGSFGLRLTHWLRGPWSTLEWGAVAVLAVTVLLAAAFSILGTPGSSPSESANAAPPTNTSPQTTGASESSGNPAPGTVTPAPAVTESDPVNVALDFLLDELKLGTGGTVTKLRETHLPYIGNTSRQDFVKLPAFPWVLLKLVLVRKGVLTRLSPELGDPETQIVATRAKAIDTFSYDQATKRLLKVVGDEAAMLVYASCRAWQRPGLPPAGDNPELLFADRCDSFTQEQWAQGLQAMAAWLNGIREKAATPKA